MKGFRARAESQISRGLPSCVLSQRPSEIKNLARKSSRLHVGFSESFRRNQNRHSSPISATQEVFQVAGIIEVGRGILGLGTGVGILAALTWSGLPVISASNKQKEQRNNVDDEDAIGVKWGVMTLLSFLPLFNWLAWIFAAFEDKDRASFYYILAILYGAPQLNAGFQQNWFSVATLLAGILHVQAERLADEKGVAQKFTLDSNLQEKPAEASKLIEDTAKSFADAVQSNIDFKERRAEEESRDASSEELKQWDSRFNRKDKK